MRFRLWDSFRIDTALSGLEAREVLSAYVAPSQNQEEGKFFVGKVSEKGFSLTRMISYRNSFLPVIHGCFEATSRGTVVSVQMRPHVFTAVFIGLWFSIFCVLNLVGLGYHIYLRLPFELRTLLAPAALLFGGVLAHRFFWSEADIARELLEDILLKRRIVWSMDANKNDRLFS